MRTNRFTSWASARVAFASVAVAGVAVLAACSEGGVASDVNAPSLRFGQTTVAIANATIAKVCVSGPLGIYTFVNSGFSQGAGGTTVENVADGTPYTLTVTGGNPTPCVDVLTRTSVVDTAATSDAFSSVTVTQTAGPAGSAFSTSNCEDDAGVQASTGCGTIAVTISANKFHGSKVTFVNVAPVSTGCTYTFGWYKNQGNATVPSTSFFGTAWTWKQVLAYKGQGNAYYTLADQYIPAKLNVGATTPPADVAAALLAAETFFTGRALGSTTGYTAAQLLAITITLNNFNDGLSTGWPHC